MAAWLLAFSTVMFTSGCLEWFTAITALMASSSLFCDHQVDRSKFRWPSSAAPSVPEQAEVAIESKSALPSMSRVFMTQVLLLALRQNQTELNTTSRRGQEAFRVAAVKARGLFCVGVT